MGLRVNFLAGLDTIALTFSLFSFLFKGDTWEKNPFLISSLGVTFHSPSLKKAPELIGSLFFALFGEFNVALAASTPKYFVPIIF